MSNYIPNTDLRVEITNKQVLKIALPISLALLIPQINFVANTIFLSHLGETELGAAGITGVYYLVFALIGSGLNNGLQSLMARRAGENRPMEIGRMFAQSIYIALLLAAAGIVLTYLISPWFLHHALSIPAVQDDSISFLRIRIWGLPFIYLFQMGNALFVGTNNSKYMKYGFAIEAALNIFLDYVLINGKWGFPKMGFNGAAIASVISEFTGFAIVAAIIFYKGFHQRFALFRHTRLNKKLSSLIFRQSSPLILQFVLSVGAWFLFYVLIENSGTGENRQRPLAISNTMRNIFAVFGVFVWAFASTANAMISNVIGQGKKEQVLHLVNKIAKLSFFFTLVLSLLINSFPSVFLSIYGREEDFIAASTPVLRMVSVALLLMSFATVWLNSVTGTANTKVNLGIEMVAILLYSIYVYFVLRVWHLGLVWAWASEFLYWSVILTLSYFYMRSGKWKMKEV